MKRMDTIGALVLLGAVSIAKGAVASEASTHFSVIVPANNDNNRRDSTLVVTSHADGAEVSIRDTSEDGDDDDSAQVILAKGQSYLARIRDGAVNDDAGGKWDGDRFIIDSTHPVTVMLQTRSDWQHDWVPSEGGSMRGNEFILHGVRNGWDFDVVAYENGTVVEIFRITTTSKVDSGTTSVELPGELVLHTSLDRGENLRGFEAGSGNNLSEAGHSYRVITSQPSTVAYGALDRNVRDGGGYVPGENGTTVGRVFYFPAIAERWAPHEKEVRIVSGDLPSRVTVRGWSRENGWGPVLQEELVAYGHADLTGRSSPALRGAEMLEVIATEDVNVFYANWLETGSVGTSDVFTYVSALDSVGASDVGQQFVAYLGPPGYENRVANVRGTYSHLFAAAFAANTTVTVEDADTGGSVVSRTVTLAQADDIADIQISVEEYNQLNRPGEGQRPYLRVEADKPISLAMNNWNDNWLAFASGVVPAALHLDVTAPPRPPCGVPIEFGVSVENIGQGTVSGLSLEVSALGGASVLTEPAVIGALGPGDSAERVVGLQVSCAQETGAELAGVSVIALGTDDNAVRVAAAETRAVPVLVPAGVAIHELQARPEQCAVELSWATEEDGDVDYLVSRESADGNGVRTVIGQVASNGVSASGFQYGFRDATATTLTPYRYYVEAVGPDAVLASAGPTMASPGLPYSVPPGRTGRLEEDYSEVGVVIRDANDVAADGFDVRSIAIAYDSLQDKLYLAASADGVLGDADGDGDPDTGGGDRALFSLEEGFAFSLDFNGDDEPDAVVGIPFGADLNLLTVGSYNLAVGDLSPTLAFLPLPTLLDGAVTAQVLNEPRANAPDLELVVNNVSLLASGEALENIGVSFYLVGADLLTNPERVPNAGMRETTSVDNRAEGCGEPTAQIHLGKFAVFGNVFSGSPQFDFIPLGWNHDSTSESIAEAPAAVPGEVISSPIVFLDDAEVRLQGRLHEPSFDLPGSRVGVHDFSVKRNGSLVHVSELTHEFPAAGEDDRYENYDVQVFRLFTLDCSARVTIRQQGTSGPLLDDRRVRMADNSVAVLEGTNPALVLAHSGLGTFQRGGDIARVNFGIPEDWTSLFGPQTAPEFTHYAFLDDLSYHDAVALPDDLYVYPLGEQGVEVGAGLWFVNHYLWTYANSGTTRIETEFTPGPDCGGTL